MCFNVKESVSRGKICIPIKGTKARIYYALPEWIATEPSIDLGAATTLAEGIVVATPFTFEAGEFFRHIDITTETGAIVSTAEGEMANMGIGNKFEGEAAPSNDILGFINGYLNTPMIFIIPEADGRNRIMGSKDLPAYFSAFEATSGKKAADKKFVSLNFMAPGLIAPVYTGTVQIAA